MNNTISFQPSSWCSKQRLASEVTRTDEKVPAILCSSSYPSCNSSSL